MEIEKNLPSHLFARRDLDWGWPPLYALTLFLQLLTGFVRALVAALVLLIVNIFTKWWFSVDLPVNLLALVIGYTPALISLATLAYPFGGWIWQQEIGGRRPSEREQAVLDLEMAQLQEASPELRPPGRWIMVDSGVPNLYAYLNTVAVTTRMLHDPLMRPTLAHELGHLNTADARVTAAVNRLIIPPRDPVEPIFPYLGALVSGRTAMAIMSIPWGIWWRRREFVADAYAERLGEASELAEFLDELGGDVATPWKSFGASSHPWTEHRIEALEKDDD
jgi:Zn-dependent protease with chaperone function